MPSARAGRVRAARSVTEIVAPAVISLFEGERKAWSKGS
jgi:hypothetical protein